VNVWQENQRERERENKNNIVHIASFLFFERLYWGKKKLKQYGTCFKGTLEKRDRWKGMLERETAAVLSKLVVILSLVQGMNFTILH
jgi:hypothetical protein